MTKINLGKSSVKTSGTPPNQNSKPYRCYQTHCKQNANSFTTAFTRHQQGVLEGNSNKSFFSGNGRRHSIRKNDTMMATKTAMDTDMVNIT